MKDSLGIKGFIEVYKIHKNGVREKVYEHANTIGTQLNSACMVFYQSRSVDLGAEAIAWGSHRASVGTFLDSDWAGTTSSGTKGNLQMSSVGTSQVKFSGTFSFSTTKYINRFQLGRTYTPAGAGVTRLFTTIYNYDNSLQTGSTSLQYDNGETLIVDWTTQFGS